MKKNKTLNDLGEFGLINHISKDIKTYQKSTKKGIGDDAAVIGEGELLTLVSTDLLLEGVHFDLSYVPLKHLGYKAVTVNLSDITAMNGNPEQITVSLALSNRFGLAAVEELYKGFRKACEQYQVDLIGGDTSTSISNLMISVTALGSTLQKNITYRNTAKKNEIICVSGDLGAAYIGLQILQREKQVFLADPNMQPDLTDKDYVIGRQLKPEARTDIVKMLETLQIIPSAMIDISDGLASELMHICSQSKLGAVIYEDKIPIDKETYQIATEEFKIPLSICALNGGEDYELLFTIRQKDYEKIKNHEDISFIGYTTAPEEGIKLVTRAKQSVDIKAQGWKHF